MFTELLLITLHVQSTAFGIKVVRDVYPLPSKSLERIVRTLEVEFNASLLDKTPGKHVGERD